MAAAGFHRSQQTREQAAIRKECATSAEESDFRNNIYISATISSRGTGSFTGPVELGEGVVLTLEDMGHGNRWDSMRVI